MFDRTFVRFAIGFITVIAVSLCTLYITGHLSRSASGAQSASANGSALQVLSD